MSKNSLTFKLSQSEKKSFNESGDRLTETLVLPSALTLTYSLNISDKAEAAFKFVDSEIILSLPQTEVSHLALPSKEGISFRFESLRVFVKVDLLPKE